VNVLRNLINKIRKSTAFSGKLFAWNLCCVCFRWKTFMENILHPTRCLDGLENKIKLKFQF